MIDKQRNKILSYAAELMLSRGVRTVTMDEVASGVGISKRTLYELFESKDALVRSLFFEQFSCYRFDHLPALAHPLEQLLRLFIFPFSHRRVVCEQFRIDVRNLYPDVLETHSQDCRNRLAHEAERVIRSGVVEGFFRPDLDVELTVAMLVKGALLFSNPTANYDLDTSPERLLDFLYSVLAFGLLTEKGREQLVGEAFSLEKLGIIPSIKEDN